MNPMTNWKTNLSGVAAIMSAVADIIHSLSAGAPVNWSADVPAIIAGVGLLFAKDSSTSSTQAQVNTATAKAADSKETK